MIKGKKLVSILLLIFFGGVLLVGLTAYNFVKNSFYGSEDSRNTPTISLDQLSWPQGPYTIYYKDKSGLYSIKTDGTEKTLLYPAEYLKYMLLDNTGQILITSNNKIILLDDRGKNERVVYTIPSSKSVQQWNISPNEQKLVIQIVDDRKWENKEHWIADDFVVINLDENYTRYLTPSELEDYKYFQNMNWSMDSNKVYFTLTKFDSPDNGRQLYYSYNTDSDNVTKIGEEKYSLKFSEMKSLASFTSSFPSSPPAKTRDHGLPDYYYYTLISPDGKKNITISSTVKVNGEDIFFWLYNGFKGPENCRRAGWIADNNHFIIHCYGIRVVEVDTKKVAVLAEGSDAQWFGQIFQEYFNSK